MRSPWAKSLILAGALGAGLFALHGARAQEVAEPAVCAPYRAEFDRAMNAPDIATLDRLLTALPDQCSALRNEVRRARAAVASGSDHADSRDDTFGDSGPADAAAPYERDEEHAQRESEAGQVREMQRREAAAREDMERRRQEAEAAKRASSGATRGLTPPPREQGSPRSMTTPGPSPAASIIIQARGFVLARDGAVPADAIGYAIVVFAQRAEAERFCPAFRERLTFEGSLRVDTDLSIQVYRKPVEVAPVIWPVTQWRAQTDQPDCAKLVERYDYAGARTWLATARAQIEQTGGAVKLGAGPYIVTARRQGTVIVYDLSRAPDSDYGSWLGRTIEGIETLSPRYANAGVVTPGTRDQVRYWAFGVAREADDALGVFVPAYGKARAALR